MFALARYSRLALLALGALTFAAAQGCSSPSSEEEGLGDDEKGEDALTTSRADDRILDAPFYFTVPKSAINVPLNRNQYPYSTIWNPSVGVADSGLRMIVINQTNQEVANKKAARIEMAKKLARAGVLQDGDIALSFRPNLANSMAYPHIQMGVTHASLVYTQNGEAYNIDSPLDGEYVGQFSTLHFTGGTSASGSRDYGTDALQIVRPKNMDATRKASLQKWIGTLKNNLSRINGQRAQVKFQKNYLLPIFAAKRMTTKQTVTTLGKIILEKDTSTQLPMYCSEFAWHMIALSNCSAEQIQSAGPEGADCVDAPFEPMPLVSTTQGQIGLAEGPLMNLLLAPPGEREALVESTFATGAGATGLSSGHRAVAEQVADLMGGCKRCTQDDVSGGRCQRVNELKCSGLAQYYQGRAAGAPAEALNGGATQLNAGVQNIGNYSPTAFLANATLPSNERAFDYVATVVFVDGNADIEKARRLAQNPVP